MTQLSNQYKISTNILFSELKPIIYATQNISNLNILGLKFTTIRLLHSMYDLITQGEISTLLIISINGQYAAFEILQTFIL